MADRAGSDAIRGRKALVDGVDLPELHDERPPSGEGSGRDRRRPARARGRAENADLLWASRGAGPGFPGIVTRFYLQTYPAPPVMWHDTWTFRLDDTVELRRT